MDFFPCLKLFKHIENKGKTVLIGCETTWKVLLNGLEDSIVHVKCI